MAYITYQELLARYPQFKSWHEGNESLVNSFAIYYAESELNGRLAPAFSVPFSPAPSMIKDLTFDLTYARMMRSLDPDKYTEFYDSVVERIQGVVDGAAVIVTDSGTQLLAALPAGEIWSSTMNYHPVHSMLDAESEYTRVSSEQLYDLENERI
jgi:hypothetical protein